MKLRSQRAIVMEYRRVTAAKPKAQGHDWEALVGAQQALAWVLNDNAMAPAKCYSPWKPKRKKGKPAP